ncbi:MAG: hypothetical protein NTW55_02570 [Planctomycetota bacterium]|nr:hypothetical protein [Planctomycetota bacterium]
MRKGFFTAKLAEGAEVEWKKHETRSPKSETFNGSTLRYFDRLSIDKPKISFLISVRQLQQ